MQTWNWKQSPDLMARLTKAQNALRTPIDIMTYAGWCETEAALKAHVERYEAEVAAQPARKVRRSKVAA
jgi:hypothetical protein